MRPYTVFHGIRRKWTDSFIWSGTIERHQDMKNMENGSADEQH